MDSNLCSLEIIEKCRNFLFVQPFAGELTRRRNQIFHSLLKTYEKLKKLGLIYHNGKVISLQEEEEINA